MNKICTSIEQAKKLAEFLPLESADMCLTFVNNVWNPVWGKTDDIYKLQKDCYEPDYAKDEYVDFDEFEPKIVPCWSLSVLLGLMPTDDKKDEYYVTTESHSDYYTVNYRNCWDGCIHSEYSEESLLDAAFEMVVWLKENGKLYEKK